MSHATPETQQTLKGFAAQFPRNLAANIAYFLVNVVIGLLLVPYFIDTLGVAAYGIIPLATSVTGYVAIVVQSLNAAVSRFLTIDLQQEDYVAANKTFNTAFFGLTVVILLMVPIIFLIAWFVPSIFNVPTGQETGTILLFLGVSAAAMIRAWSGNFTVQIFAYNRLDLQNLVNLTNLVAQTGLIIFFFTLFGPNLALVGGAHLAGAIMASGASVVLARRICPHLSISLRSFDRSKVKDLCSLGCWGVVDQIGSFLLLQIDLIVVNLLFGTIAAGEYAIALQWGILLRSIAGTLTGVLVPTILAYYALEQTETLIGLTQGAIKFMGLAMALPTGLICGFAPQLLTIWVGAEHASLAPLVVLLTAHLAINMSILPLFSVNAAYNRIRIPGIVTILLGGANLILAIAIPLMTGWGYYGVAVAGVLILTFRHVLFIPWYTAKILNIRMTTYIKPLLHGTLAVLLLGGAAAGITVATPLPSFLTLVIAVPVISLMYGIMVLRFGLTSFEKQLFESYLPQGWRKFYETARSDNNN
jgi:O-antigen/teichoic acid export membrane protein